MWTIHCPGVFGLLRLSTRHSSTAHIASTMNAADAGALRSVHRPLARLEQQPMDQTR